jgi:hypothetical protein
MDRRDCGGSCLSRRCGGRQNAHRQGGKANAGIDETESVPGMRRFNRLAHVATKRMPLRTWAILFAGTLFHLRSVGKGANRRGAQANVAPLFGDGARRLVEAITAGSFQAGKVRSEQGRTYVGDDGRQVDRWAVYFFAAAFLAAGFAAAAFAGAFFAGAFAAVFAAAFAGAFAAAFAGAFAGALAFAAVLVGALAMS